MNMRLAALFLAVTSGFCSAAEPAAGVYVELDSHWYTAASGPTRWFYNGYGFFMPTADMTGCARQGGQTIPFGLPGLFVGQFSFPIYQILGFEIQPLSAGAIAYRYTTVFGDVVCDGAIPSPIPDEMFANGFEVASCNPAMPGETIFEDGLEAN